MKSSKKGIEKFQLVTDKICTLLERGVKPWQKQWNNGVAFSNLLSGHAYQGINPTLCSTDCLINGYSSPYFIGFTQASELGWKVKKGSQATWLFWGGLASKEIENKETGEKTQEFYSTAKWLKVFNVDCLTDANSDRKISEYLPPIQPKKNPDQRIEEVEKFIKAQNIEITTSVGDRACYIPSLDVISLPSYDLFHSAQGYYATVLHELCHATGATHRLNRPISNKRHTQAYAYEELIAELGSAMTGYHLDFQGDYDNNASYIQSWLTALRNDKKYFFNAAKEARRASKYLLETAGMPVS